MRRTRSKSVLFLMELTIVILLFSISAAVCMMIFAQAKRMSINSKDLTGAVMHAQSAVEVYKATGGDWDETARFLNAGRSADGGLSVFYDADWTPSVSAPVYIISAKRTEDAAAQFTVSKTGSVESVIFEISVRVPGGVR